MKHQMIKFLFLLLSFLLLPVFYALHSTAPSGETIANTIEPRRKILLIPLDSRPPCKSDVIERGRLLGYDVITPPADISDYYTKPSDARALESFIEAHVDEVDFILLSIDNLLYGSLLASREGGRTDDELNASLAFLRNLHEMHPKTPIEAFFILPRLAAPAAIEDYDDNKNLIEYSKLVDRYTLHGDERDAARIATLEDRISPYARAIYMRRYTENERIANLLIDMAQEGTLSRLWIGQDDGASYSIGNMEKRRLQERLDVEHTPKERVALLHGADELALTMLTAHALQKTAHVPRIYLDYNDPTTPQKTLPYMAISMEETAREKIELLGGKIVSHPDDAELILYLSAGSPATLDSRQKAAKEIECYVNEGKSLALVDLSERFLAEETIFPLLLPRSMPLHALASYAGWNTASNSIGTALSDALLYSLAQMQVNDEATMLSILYEHVAILNGSFLEDYYYLKDVIDLVNTGLKVQGYRNVNDLDLQGNFLWATARLQEILSAKKDALTSSPAYRTPFSVHTKTGQYLLRVRDLRLESAYPWPRTFEIYVRTTPTVLRIR